MNLGRAVAVFRGEHEFHVDIIGRRRLWFLLSGAAVTISIAALLLAGLNLGIDFQGGAVMTFENPSGASVQEIQQVVSEEGHPEAVVQETGENELRVRTESLGEERGELLDAVAGAAGIGAGAISVDDVGPEWGQQISSKALQGLLIFLVAVTIYMSFRFEWKMAFAGIAAMFHDVFITAGVYSLLRREVTPETVIAVLTILGYSLYDTVVIFDRIRENAGQVALVQRQTYAGMVNTSMNQVLMRSFNTTLTTLFPVGALLFFGGETLGSFAFALFIGLLLGAYSSVFLAAPLVAVLKEREPRMTEIRERAARREVRPTRAPSGDGEATERRDLVTAAAPAASRRPSQQRRKPKKKPRSKRKRR